MVYLYDACDQISDFCHQQLLRKIRRKISWTERGKTVYPPPLSGSGGIMRNLVEGDISIQLQIICTSRGRGKYFYTIQCMYLTNEKLLPNFLWLQCCLTNVNYVRYFCRGSSIYSCKVWFHLTK